MFLATRATCSSPLGHQTCSSLRVVSLILLGMLPLTMQRSSSAGPVLETKGKDTHKNQIRIELDYQARHHLKKTISYEAQTNIADRNLKVGNPILQAAMERDKIAIKAERESGLLRFQQELRHCEVNAMWQEDNPYSYRG